MTALTLLAESTRGGDADGAGGILIIVGIILLVVLVTAAVMVMLGGAPWRRRPDTRPNPDG